MSLHISTLSLTHPFLSLQLFLYPYSPLVFNTAIFSSLIINLFGIHCRDPFSLNFLIGPNFFALFVLYFILQAMVSFLIQVSCFVECNFLTSWYLVQLWNLSWSEYSKEYLIKLPICELYYILSRYHVLTHLPLL